VIPSYFVVFDELPITSSDKVDWRRLLAPVRAAQLSDDDLLYMLEILSDEEAVRMFDDLSDRS
jgi:hypothetical protein